MESAINNGMCRCCASEGTFKDLKSAYQWMGDEEVYSEMLRECFDITLFTNIEGEVEGGICEVCVTQLRNASNFKKQVLQTEEQFKLRLQDKLFKNDIVKVEAQPDSDNDSDNDHASEDYSEYEVPIKLESDEPKPKKRGAKASTSRAKRTKTDDGETSKRVEEIIINVEKEDYELLEPEITIVEDATSDSADLLEKLQMNVKEILLNSNATPLKGHSPAGYECCFCEEKFTLPGDLKQHTLTAHEEAKIVWMKDKPISKFVAMIDITSLQCTICKQIIDNLELLLVHLRDSHQKEVYTDVRNQIMAFNLEPNKFQCYSCKRVFPKFKALRRHMNEHNQNFVCVVCNAGFINSHSLNCHKVVHEHARLVHKCAFCDKVFEGQRQKKSHERSVHTDIDRLNPCEQCGEVFKNYAKKVSHLAVAHGFVSVEYKCSECPKSFPARSDLMTHMKEDHSIEPRFPCGGCEMKFLTAKDLKEHMVEHTGQLRFKCHMCDKAYAKKSNLQEHMRCHDQKRFKCDVCLREFLHKCSLKRHLENIHQIFKH